MRVRGVPSKSREKKEHRMFCFKTALEEKGIDPGTYDDLHPGGSRRCRASAAADPCWTYQRRTLMYDDSPDRSS